MRGPSSVPRLETRRVRNAVIDAMMTAIQASNSCQRTLHAMSGICEFPGTTPAARMILQMIIKIESERNDPTPILVDIFIIELRKSRNGILTTGAVVNKMMYALSH